MDKNQKILIVGPDGSGKTQIAKWATKLFKHRDAYFMICHQEMTTSDIVGCYTTSKEKIVEWKDGPIVKAAKEGRALIIDQLENASPQVIERINPILDAYSNVLLNKKTGSHNSTRFSVTECFEGLEVRITDHFQIIATVTKNQLKNLSPALKNRFTIIEIDFQIDPSKAQEQVKELINALLETKKGNQISFSENLINEIIKIDGISNISKIVNGLRIICTKYPNFNSDSAQRAIFNALKEIYIDHKTPELHESIREVIIRKITGPTTGFYFKDSPPLENIVSLIILMQNIGQHIVLQSGTGFEKTSAAVSLAKGLNFNAYKVSFNAETKLSDLIGNITISRGKSDNSKGQLLKAIKEGGFFIADEANLAEINVLQSIIIALEQKPGESIEIPSVGTTIIHEKYFFIVCQNDNTMFGRKPLPQVLLKRVVCFDYPFPINSIKEVIKLITSEYNLPLLTNALTDFVININKKFQEDDKIRPWSFREVRRFCRRVKNSEPIEFLQNNDEWNKISFAPSAMMHALFMSWMMCPDPEKSTKTICQVVGESFGYPDIDKLVSILSTDAVPQDNYVIKGILRIKSVFNIENSKRVPESISSFWNAVFLASLVPPTDPLLIVGESSFKTFLANSITVDPSQVTLGSETTTASLIGQVSYVRQQTYERILLDLLHTIMISNEKLYPKFTDFKKNFVRNKENLDKLVEFTKQIDVPYLKKSVDYITKQLIADIPNTAIGDYTTVFKPGLITHYLFRQSPIIIKNFSKPPTSVIERFNELLSIEPELTLTEDYTNTITPEKDKTIKISLDQNSKYRFRIIALSSLNDFNRISEAMKSRFNIISIKPYTVAEKKTITGLSDKYVNDPKFHIHKLILMKSIIDQIQTIQTNILNSSEEIPKEKLEVQAAKILGTENNQCEEFKTPLKIDDGYLKSDNPYILSYSAPSVDPTNSNIVFTKTTQTMCVKIFTALSLDIPIIIQGPTGTCKSMLADYVASLMKDFANNIHVIKIQLSRSTTVEDLFGRNSIKVDINGNKIFDYIPTELFKAAS
ncbi:hypothetical protein TVAG_300610 [Trichomonas vaginalis G3]|uniref:ATPase dynein-related AAA domain-containing protein n=1 Tax=Trichomonas vaginalis (strain ATCC PRA-98 / G3) TaxID=412133 RepID=A2EP41_TRIV3|nr:nuclear chaperone required for maturation and nuclear export of pre-60s ribosome subunits [Trichomonas vaginalis G3]EAY05579.1 hypothetical protein TVAG_300610 [Trichomonas vaginalis G3]KAI5547517.1 nuclear chaperone required for maturation and nuclear export of pre-60s ribosome subunits [Trichomonas vaginalis G3]|eukprot:XP_001317802.1 hypothetical protein [Trichomonas vaginalis G3]